MTTPEAYNIYLSLGLAPDKAMLAASQSAFETTYNGKTWNSPVFLKNNNVGGIMFVNRSFQKNAVSGSAFPQNEWPNLNTPIYYAKFATIKDSFIDHIRITYKALINSNNSVEYARNLKAQGYYTGNEQAYAKNLNYVYNILAFNLKKKVPDSMTAGASFIIKAVVLGLIITNLLKLKK